MANVTTKKEVRSRAYTIAVQAAVKESAKLNSPKDKVKITLKGGKVLVKLT